MAGSANDTGGTADSAEIARFAARAADWWNAGGAFRPLHQINAARLQFIRAELLAQFQADARSLRPFEGLTLLDLGCGGGLVAEPMARLGFRVTGADADAEAIAVAEEHAADLGLPIEYRTAAAEEVADTGARFDAVLALELVEHVADTEALFGAIGRLVRPGGVFIGATLNRTPQAFALAVVGAEYLLGWLPRGTHDWRRFVRPSEFVGGLRRHGLVASRLAGLAYDAIGGTWRISDSLAVNYLVVARRR
ncbi:MAG TPA: bifunctional 2-polyprenyl-6-hydroxyphenol methylase/3-demethylubiquinol 3-O-methyltransferase UbiG [Stellaceae bacterium]|nr:bifunctional 2-polyprenyl-6-hydroxyphenol methylase/3-demethylubiquinol 3-O-methyltransferase UbiG [Stellaceae bacterium]